MTGFYSSLYTDPEREIYKSLGLKEIMEHGNSTGTYALNKKKMLFIFSIVEVCRAKDFLNMEMIIKRQQDCLS